MCTKNELQQILNTVSEAYRSVYGDNIRRIVLYGSYARGDYTDSSDIDIAAIVDGERTALQSQLKKIWDISAELELEYETIISPTVIPSDEFENYKNDLVYYKNIWKEGIEVVA